MASSQIGQQRGWRLPVSPRRARRAGFSAAHPERSRAVAHEDQKPPAPRAAVNFWILALCLPIHQAPGSSRPSRRAPPAWEGRVAVRALNRKAYPTARQPTNVVKLASPAGSTALAEYAPEPSSIASSRPGRVGGAGGAEPRAIFPQGPRSNVSLVFMSSLILVDFHMLTGVFRLHPHGEPSRFGRELPNFRRV